MIKNEVGHNDIDFCHDRLYIKAWNLNKFNEIMEIARRQANDLNQTMQKLEKFNLEIIFSTDKTESE